MEKYCDLHSHSTVSDGSFTPTELILEAERIGLEYIALTDHDTVGGISEAIEASKGKNIKLITGIELSIDAEEFDFLGPDLKSIHVLGYLSHENIFKMEAYQAKLLAFREERNIKTIEKACEIGMPFTYEELKKYSTGEIVSKGHFYKLLIEKGYAKDKDDAFARFLLPGGLIFVKKRKISAADAVGMIVKNGGVAVFAHPLLMGLEAEVLDKLIVELKAIGISGLESIYSENKPGETEKVIALAKKHGMIITGGSDFHGIFKPGLSLGVGYGALRVPSSLGKNLAELLL
ncbi:MAG: PHP domain-containing protein [Bacillota bacterium]